MFYMCISWPFYASFYISVIYVYGSIYIYIYKRYISVGLTHAQSMVIPLRSKRIALKFK